MNFSRAIVLVLVTGFLAVLTSFMPLIPKGLMAAALAMSLSIGTVLLSWNQNRKLKAPERAEIVLVGLVSGLAGGALAALIQSGLPGARYEFLPPPVPAWFLLVSGTLYGVVLHLSCRRPSIKEAVLWSAVGCLGVRVVSGVAAGLEPVAVVFLGLFGAVPFGVLWTLATIKLTPAPLPTQAGASAISRSEGASIESAAVIKEHQPAESGGREKGSSVNFGKK